MGYYCTVGSNLWTIKIKRGVDLPELVLKMKCLAEKGGQRANENYGSRQNRYAKAAILDFPSKLINLWGLGNEKYSESEEQDFLDFLIPYLEKGSYLGFTGEDGSHWRNFFDGKKWHYQDGTIVFDDAYDHFLKVYKGKLTTELKKRLDKWRTAINI